MRRAKWLKRTLLCSVCVLFILAGCTQQVEEVEEKSVSYHFILEPERSFSFKKPLVWEVVLKDEQRNATEVINLNDYGYDPRNEGMDQGQLEYLARTLAEGIDRPMRNPTIDEEGNIIPGENRVILSEDELVNILMSLQYNEKNIVLPIYETVPTVKEEDLDGIKDFMIGTYTTYFNSGVVGRSQNILLSSEAIQHHVLGPGDEFSFNKVVGERTRERGYQEANEIINNEFVIGIGGGICQTSSTLFNAIDSAGLFVMERHAHSRDIGYVPPNRDATVSWGGPDFRFTNPYDQPVLIRTEVFLDRGEITVKVFSKKEKDSLLVVR